MKRLKVDAVEERRMTVSEPEGHNGPSEQRSSDSVADLSHYTLILGNSPGPYRVAAAIESAIRDAGQGEFAGVVRHPRR